MTTTVFSPFNIFNYYQVGSIHLTITTFLIFFQILFFIVFYRLSKILNSTPFKIIKHHGILSFLQQICHLVTSIRTILGKVEEDLLNALTGSILNSSFMAGVALTFLLTLNRCDIIFNNCLFSRIDRKKFYKNGIIVCYIYLILLTIFYLFPCFQITFDTTDYQWLYTYYCPYSDIGSQFEGKSVLLLLGLSTILYIIMFLKLLHLRSLTTSTNIFEVKDIKLLAYLFMCIFSIALFEFFWEESDLDIFSSQVTSMIPQLIFIFISGSNTLFTFCFVKEIRNEALNILCCRHSNRVQNIINKPNTVRI
uniref:7TM_GPCR_Srx domain-containing protein n=1 Tax=Parastrongyloides trichosuri TaxID=131310 RepID=A0A0N4ZI03_PARTI